MAERTKIWIADAMKRLLVKKPLEKIFVTEICREAEIERPTFYYHFQDKYDLMAWIFCQRTLQTDVLSSASAAAAMNRMRQDYIFYKRAYEDNSQSPMWSYMHEYFVRQYSELVKEKTGTDPDARTQFSIRLYCYGTLGMTREWLLKDNITPADVIVRMMFDSMPDHLRKIYF
ncbi:MAG: TetR/AcrR family transcriptional regulator C-terminal domain-containing protein [Lachnospiraceae bacterium]|nr:TetR/AcrR family transcriptional regulator C-terminal domain-containing protein [Lachnospiraceae bacterium]